MISKPRQTPKQARKKREKNKLKSGLDQFIFFIGLVFFCKGNRPWLQNKVKIPGVNFWCVGKFLRHSSFSSA